MKKKKKDKKGVSSRRRIRSSARLNRGGEKRDRERERDRIWSTQLKQSIPVVPELSVDCCNNPVLIIITSGRMRALSTFIKVSAESNHD